MSAVVLDLETLPLASSLTETYNPADFPPPATYKSGEAITNHHRRKEADWRRDMVKRCSLNPRLGRILCVGVSVEDYSDVYYAESETEERVAIQATWNLLAQNDGRIVTWNGYSFDCRFLVMRSIANGIVPSVSPEIIRRWFRRYSTSPHFDAKAVLLNTWGSYVAGEGLDEWCRFFGLAEKPAGIDGSTVHALYAQGKHQEIKDYCAHDVASTHDIYSHLIPYYGEA